MKYLTTESVKHLKIKSVKVDMTHFPEGELYLRIKEDPRGKAVTIISNITKDNLLELLLLVDAAKHAGAKIKRLIIPYMSYARQDRIYTSGEPISGGVICTVLKNLKIPVTIYDIHSEALKRYLKFKPESVLPLLAKKLQRKKFLVVTPDVGGRGRAERIANLLRLPLSVIKKTRRGQNISMQFSKDVSGRDILLVEDMISTGTTLIKASRLLKQHGARDIYCISAHGLFVGNAREKLKTAPVKKIIVSNSLPNKKSAQIEVVDISSYLR
ncbi:MAG: ribose-phosphate pyrophosphokinase [DPANN group archaeon]|nr:ribose-phosphate pyrophosphokinase [DPANN group archaeon]